MARQCQGPTRQAPPLSEDMEVAVREVEDLKAALRDDGEASSYLGLRGTRDKDALLQLLLSGMQQLDRLREKEIVLLRKVSGRAEQCQSALPRDHAAASGENDATGLAQDRDTDLAYYYSCW